MTTLVRFLSWDPQKKHSFSWSLFLISCTWVGYGGYVQGLIYRFIGVVLYETTCAGMGVVYYIRQSHCRGRRQTKSILCCVYTTKQ